MEERARSDYCDLGRALRLIAFGIIMAVIQRKAQNLARAKPLQRRAEPNPDLIVAQTWLRFPLPKFPSRPPGLGRRCSRRGVRP